MAVRVSRRPLAGVKRGRNGFKSQIPAETGGWVETLAQAFCLARCHSFAVAVATKRYLHLLIEVPSALEWLSGCRGGAWEALRRISFARLAARSLKRPPRVHVEGQIHHLQASCVLAFFHSPWDRLLARWAGSHGLALTLAGDRMASLLAGLYVAPDPSGFRRLVRHLRGGGRAAVGMDFFVDAGGLPARFFNAPVRVLPLTIRLAGVSGVPVVPMSVVYRRRSLHLRIGPAIHVDAGVPEETRAVRAVLSFFEATIRDDPAAWRGLLRFLRTTPTIVAGSRMRVDTLRHGAFLRRPSCRTAGWWLDFPPDECTISLFPHHSGHHQLALRAKLWDY